MTASPEKEEIQKTALRVPRSLHTKIHAAAAESGRTMNAEIVHRLEQSFAEGEGGVDATQFLRLAFMSGEEVPETYKAAYSAIFRQPYVETSNLALDYVIGRLKRGFMEGGG